MISLCRHSSVALQIAQVRRAGLGNEDVEDATALSRKAQHQRYIFGGEVNRSENSQYIRYPVQRRFVAKSLLAVFLRIKNSQVAVAPTVVAQRPDIEILSSVRHDLLIFGPAYRFANGKIGYCFQDIALSVAVLSHYQYAICPKGEMELIKIAKRLESYCTDPHQVRLPQPLGRNGINKQK